MLEGFVQGVAFPHRMLCHRDLAHDGLGLRRVAEIEVAEHDVTVGVQEDVLRLEVAVDVPEEVEVLQREEDLRGVEPHVLLGEALLGLRHEQLEQLPPLAVLHHKVHVPLRLEPRVHCGEEGMVHFLQHRLLYLHAVDLITVDHLHLVESFDGVEAAAVHARAALGALELHQAHGADVALPQRLHRVEVLHADLPLRLVRLHNRVSRRVPHLVGLAPDGQGAVDGSKHLAGVLEGGDGARHRLDGVVVIRLGRRLGLGGRPCGACGLLLVGDIALDSHIEPYVAAAIKDGGEGEHVPEGAAVLAVVEEAHGALRARLDGVPDLVHRARVGARALQEAAVPAQHLLAGVPGELEKVVRGEDDGVVRQRGVADAEVLLDALQRRAQVQPRARPGHHGNLVATHTGVGGRLREHAWILLRCPLRLGHPTKDLRHPRLSILFDTRVVLHQQRQALAVGECCFDCAFCFRGHVHLHTNELRDGTVFKLNGCNSQEVPEGSSVLPVVQEANGTRQPLMHRIANFLHVCLIRLLSL
mmetsp:Transcript_21837/g.47931  ORF Transcript_21837/g.47931 Transcript_21837/m.47931 type:complete len:529 (-) Transcript_21837:321-1907(-)